MRYYLDSSTLFIRGSFRAARNDIGGGVRPVSTLLIHSVPQGQSHEDPEKELRFVVTGAGLDDDFLGLLTAVPVNQLCVLQYDFITVFITAGVRSCGRKKTISRSTLSCAVQRVWKMLPFLR